MKSTKSVGQLYPVLLSKDGKVIDGHHRLEDEPDWRTETLNHIDTEEKILLARAISNWHRRTISKPEKTEWINGLARIYYSEGLKVYGENPSTRGGPAINEIMNRLIVELGICRQTISTYLDARYKQKGKGGNQGGPRVPAIQAIETLAKNNPRLADDVVERYEKEVREKLLHDPDFQDEVIEAREDPVVEEEPEPMTEEEAELQRQNYHNLVAFFRDELNVIRKGKLSTELIESIKDRRALKRYGILVNNRGHKLSDKALVTLNELNADSFSLCLCKGCTHVDECKGFRG